MDICNKSQAKKVGRPLGSKNRTIEKLTKKKLVNAEELQQEVSAKRPPNMDEGIEGETSTYISHDEIRKHLQFLERYIERKSNKDKKCIKEERTIEHLVAVYKQNEYDPVLLKRLEILGYLYKYRNEYLTIKKNLLI